MEEKIIEYEGICDKVRLDELGKWQTKDKDDHDFHQEISPLSAAHYTIDQFGLTTPKPLVAYTKRAHVFVDSLAAISIGAVFYVAVSFFSPIRIRS